MRDTDFIGIKDSGEERVTGESRGEGDLGEIKRGVEKLECFFSATPTEKERVTSAFVLKLQGTFPLEERDFRRAYGEIFGGRTFCKSEGGRDDFVRSMEF